MNYYRHQASPSYKLRTLFFLVLTILFFSISQVWGATFTSVTNGAWTSPATWGTASTPTFGDIVVIQHAVTLAAGTYSGNGSVTIQNGGSLTVTGNLAITANGTKMIVGTNGQLVVSGTLGVNNQSNLSLTGGTISVGGTMTVAGGTYNATSGTASAGNLTTTNNGNTSFTNGANATFNVNYTGAGTGNLSSNTNFTNNGTINVGGNVSHANSGGTFTSSGTVMIAGDFTANGNVQLNPGATANSKLAVGGNLTTTGNNFIVGTSTAPGTYTDLVVYKNMESTGGEITINRNGRVAVFGDLKMSAGGKDFNINSGGQVYVDGDGTGSDVIVTGGGADVINNNANVVPPFGFYVNGTVSATGGGSSVDTDRADETVMQTNNPTFYNWVTSNTNNPMPVVLAYFKISSIDERGITIGWSTTLEKDFDQFELEHAGEELVFTTISTIEGKGGIDLNTKYQFVHGVPAQGKNYYRLKSIDLDGSFEYSAVIIANWNGIDRGVSLYPNPVVNHTFTIELNDVMTSEVNLTLIESRGYVVYSAKVNGTTSTINLPDDLKPGIYLAKISSATGQDVIRVVVN